MILVTGARGFIGSALCRALDDRRMPFTAVSRRDVDLADGAAVADLMARVRPTSVVHLAACLDKSETTAARAHQWRDTFEAGRVVIEASGSAGVRHVITAGTIDELGAVDGVLYPDQPAAPLSTYGLCKDLVRRVAEASCRRSDVHIDWFRPFIVYGPAQTGPMLLPYAFETARRGHVGEFSDGLQERDFLYIDDLVAWLVLALERGRDATRGLDIHHLGTGVSVRVGDVLRAIQDHFPDARFELGKRPKRPGEPQRQCGPSPAAAGTPVQAWNPHVSSLEGISRTAEWWKRQVLSPTGGPSGSIS